MHYNVPAVLALVALVWIGARFTWLQLSLYPVIATSLCVAATATAATLLFRWQSGPRQTLTPLWVTFALMLVALILAVSVSMILTALTFIAVTAVVVIARRMPQSSLARGIASSILTTLPVFAGAAAVDPVLAWQLPQVLVAAAITLLFVLVLNLTALARKHLPDRPGRPRTAWVMAALVLWFVLVLTMIVPVTVGWYSAPFRNLAVYALGLPVLGLLIFVWGNPSDTMLRIGHSTLRGGSLLVLAALALA
ncbi:hypothetical protein GF356_04725 [candidate division GN15 bacterium]|nr:hypothetical protein [candidate division GN15 bacterium]